MNETLAVELVAGALRHAVLIASPLLAILFLTGVVVGVAQAATALQDPAVSALPRLAALILGITVLLPWMAARSVDYAAGLLANLADYGR